MTGRTTERADSADREPSGRDGWAGPAGRLSDLLAAALMFALLWLSPLLAGAAPRRAAPAPRPDEIVGEYRLGAKDGPTVIIPREDEPDLEVWLVFAANESAEAFCRALAPGERVRVKGRLGFGGGWRYIVVADLSRDE